MPPYRHTQIGYVTIGALGVACLLIIYRWYHGWGIHLTMNGWLYNVSGFRAVAVRRSDGTSFQLGSDEPEVLLAAVMTHLKG
jgi:hypothetical protein